MNWFFRFIRGGKTMDRNLILIIEDDQAIRDGLSIILKENGYDVLKCRDGLEALAIIKDNPAITLALADIMMPRMDGITLISNIRKTHGFPIIVISAKSEEADKIIGLNIGADDYITKPYSGNELLARVNAQIRRCAYLKDFSLRQSALGLREAGTSQLRVGGLELSDESASVTLDGQAIKLTPIEFKILRLLMSHPGRVFPVDEIYELVWNEKAVATETVMVHIRKIREKIEIDPKHPRYLKVVWGIGYKIDAPPARKG